MNYGLFRRFTILALLLVLIASLASCSTKNSSTTNDQPATGTQDNTDSGQTKNAVTIENNTFDPATLTVKVGTTVKWTNKDGYDHTITADSGEFDSGNIPDNGTFSFTFDKAGTYDYSCIIHPGMTGQITVE